MRFPLGKTPAAILRLEALTDQGSHRLAERPPPISLPMLLTGRTLTLWHDEGGPYQLSDLSGRTLTQGYLPPKTPPHSP